MRVWDPVAGTLLHTPKGEWREVRRGVHAARRHAARPLWLVRLTVRVWDPVAGTLLHTLEGTRSVGRRARFPLPDGTPRALSGSCDKTVRVWDPLAGTALATLEGHTE